MVNQLIIDGSLVGIRPSAPSRLGVLMGFTRFGAEKLFGMVLNILRRLWEPLYVVVQSFKVSLFPPIPKVK